MSVKSVQFKSKDKKDTIGSKHNKIKLNKEKMSCNQKAKTLFEKTFKTMRKYTNPFQLMHHDFGHYKSCCIIDAICVQETYQTTQRSENRFDVLITL